MSINIINNALSSSTLDQLYEFSRDGSQPTLTNFFGWPHNVVGYSNAIFLFEIDGELKDKIADELVMCGSLPCKPTKWKANINLYSRNSGIPWHSDGQHKFACTVYLNKEWNKEWGGYFLYESGEEIKALIPTYNRAVSLVPPIPHSVSITALNAPFRESLQIFVEEF